MNVVVRCSLRRIRWTLLTPVLTSVAGCSALEAIAPPVVDEAPLECAFPTGTELCFAGEASPFELGLGLESETERSMTYVTAKPVDGGRLAPARRKACSLTEWGIAWFDVPDDWTRPRVDDSDGE